MPMVNFKSAIRHALQAAALAGALVLGACFDIEQRVVVRDNGSGSISIRVVTEDVLPDSAGLQQMLNTTVGPVRMRDYSEDGQFIHEEDLDFSSLSEVSLQDDAITLDIRDRTLWGAGPTRATLTRTLSAPGRNDDALGLVRMALRGHTYVYSMTVPGLIESIEPVLIGGLQAPAERSGNTVTWRIPLEALIGVETITFTIKFTTFGALTAAKTKPALGSAQSLLGALPDEP